MGGHDPTVAERGNSSSASTSPTNRKLIPFLLFASCSLCVLPRHVRASLLNPHNIANANMTRLLDSLVDNYDKQLRPGFGEKPLEIQTNILIRSMGPVSEEEMMFSINCYFRQSWRDERLTFQPIENVTELRPSIKMVEHIWKPDTFFLNGKNSYLHIITYSNMLFRIKSDGGILFSQRLTIKTSCPMHLHKYPMDTQLCPLFIGSYGYPSKDVNYIWVTSGNNPPVRQYKDITMAQFTLDKIQSSNQTMEENHGFRKVLSVTFLLRREIGYYFLQIYLPCYLIVIISWVSFFINREATPARVTLGITTLLATVTIAITGREGIPKVSYSTALDIFLLMCFSFVFAALIEYAGVNYFTKAGHQEGHQEDSDEELDNKPLLRTATYASTQHGIQHTLTTDVNGHTVVSVSNTVRPRDSCWTMFLHCLQGNTKYKPFRARNSTGQLSVSKIDSMARILFPFSFTCLNIFYWAGFLYYF